MTATDQVAARESAALVARVEELERTEGIWRGRALAAEAWMAARSRGDAPAPAPEVEGIEGLVDALMAAAKSLEWIAGRTVKGDEDRLEVIWAIRDYARSRAGVARAALSRSPAREADLRAKVEAVAAWWETVACQGVGDLYGVAGRLRSALAPPPPQEEPAK